MIHAIFHIVVEATSYFKIHWNRQWQISIENFQKISNIEYIPFVAIMENIPNLW